MLLGVFILRGQSLMVQVLGFRTGVHVEKPASLLSEGVMMNSQPHKERIGIHITCLAVV